MITQNNMAVLFGCVLALQTQVSIFTALIATNTLLETSTTAEFYRNNTDRLATSYRLMTSFLIKMNISYVPSDAGVYVFAKLFRLEPVSWEDERTMLQRVRHYGVNVVAGRSYHCTSPGWFRIAFAFPEDVMRSAFSRIANAIRDVEDARNKNVTIALH